MQTGRIHGLLGPPQVKRTAVKGRIGTGAFIVQSHPELPPSWYSLQLSHPSGRYENGAQW